MISSGIHEAKEEESGSGLRYYDSLAPLWQIYNTLRHHGQKTEACGGWRAVSIDYVEKQLKRAKMGFAKEPLIVVARQNQHK